MLNFSFLKPILSFSWFSFEALWRPVLKLGFVCFWSQDKKKKKKTSDANKFVWHNSYIQTIMESSYCHDITPIISIFLLFFLLFSPIFSAKDLKDLRNANTTFHSNKKLTNNTTKKINKPFVKSIKVIFFINFTCFLFPLWF